MRATDGDRFKIVNRRTGQTLTEMTRPQVYREAHTRAVYLHGGLEYLVEELDLVGHRAVVVPVDQGFYTQPDVRTQVVLGPLDEVLDVVHLQVVGLLLALVLLFPGVAPRHQRAKSLEDGSAQLVELLELLLRVVVLPLERLVLERAPEELDRLLVDLLPAEGTPDRAHVLLDELVGRVGRAARLPARLPAGLLLG